MRICETCRFWDSSSTINRDGEERGRCAAALPTVDMRSGAAVWPHPSAYDSCRHHQYEPPDFSRLWGGPSDDGIPF